MVKTRIAISLLLQVPAIIMALVRDWDETIPVIGVSVAITQLGLFVLGIYIMRRRYRSAEVDISDTERFRELGKQDAPALSCILADLCGRMGLSESIKVMLARRRYDISPSALETAEGLCIIIPLGFVKYVTQKPAEAAAILAHELGHIAQRDTKLWILAESFFVAMKRVFLPVSVGTYALVIIALMFAVNYMSEQEIREALLRPLIPCIAIPAFMYSIRQLRRQSESLADLAGAAYGPEHAMRRALEDVALFSDGSSYGVFSTHFSPKSRIDTLQKVIARHSK